eukprot:298513-Alexandrium_andersonii.AAC.1
MSRLEAFSASGGIRCACTPRGGAGARLEFCSKAAQSDRASRLSIVNSSTRARCVMTRRS